MNYHSINDNPATFAAIMRIAINARFLKPKELEGYGYFTKDVFFMLALNYPMHEFIFIFDRPFDVSIQFPQNVTAIVVPPKARHFLSFLWWFNFKIPAALRKQGVDVFVSPDGFCSLTTSTKQVVVVHDLAFLHYPSFIPKHHLLFYKLFTPQFLRKAKTIATVSEFSKRDIIERYKIQSDKIINVGNAAKPTFKEMDWIERQVVKDEYSEGFEYFVFVGGIHPRKNLLNLLKAFSLFKVRQRSAMKLLIVGRLAWQYNDTLEKLKSYKFRDDVKLVGYLHEEELVKVMASAYALVFPSFFEGFGVPVLEAMQCCVPVLTSKNSSMEEVAGDAALYFDPADPLDIAEQMKRIFKDEQLRARMIEDGKQRVQSFSLEKTAAKMWEVILGVAAK